MIVYCDKAAGLLIEWNVARFWKFPRILSNILLTWTKIIRQNTSKSLLMTQTLDNLTSFSQLQFFAQFLSNNSPNSHCEAADQESSLIFQPSLSLAFQLKSNALKTWSINNVIYWVFDFLLFWGNAPLSNSFQRPGSYWDPVLGWNIDINKVLWPWKKIKKDLVVYFIFFNMKFI